MTVTKESQVQNRVDIVGEMRQQLIIDRELALANTAWALANSKRLLDLSTAAPARAGQPH